MALKYVVPITLVVALAGCGSIGAIGLPWKREKPAEPQPLTPPAGSTAMTAPATGSGANGGLGRTDLLGGWTITSGTDSCQLFMTLTSWTGGYRASTRGCTTELLKSISAWNLSGSDVILAGQAGTPVAKLA